MRIGLDVDGVLANFFSVYEQAVIDEAGEDKFPCRYPECFPPVWDWPEHYGYDRAYIKRVWLKIAKSRSFWSELGRLPDLQTLLEVAPWVMHDVYFITARPGENAKGQTEEWLRRHGVPNPTVLITADKGGACGVLGIDVYVDDKWENIQNVVETSKTTRAYLAPQYPYNQTKHTLPRAVNLADVFKMEGIK